MRWPVRRRNERQNHRRPVDEPLSKTIGDQGLALDCDTQPHCVLERVDGRILAHDLSTMTRVVLHGHLRYASDFRVIFTTIDGQLWQDGSPADDVMLLMPSDVMVSWNDPKFNAPPPRPYWCIFRDGDMLLKCGSRSVIRLERLFGATVAAQLCQHA